MADFGPQSASDAKTVEGQGRSVSSFLELCGALEPADSRGKRKAGIDNLFRTIKGEIIPRLMLVYDDGQAQLPEEFEPGVRADDIEMLTDLVLTSSREDVEGFISSVLLRGVTAEQVFMDLLSPVARRLGEMWEDDTCSFAEVTIGLCRLHDVLRTQSSRGAPHAGLRAGTEAKRALFASVDGDQHVFGLVMVAEFFRRDGWRVWSEPGIGAPALADIVRTRPFDLLGLSAAVDRDPASIRAQIASLRHDAVNKGMKIFVGGRLFLSDASLVGKVGADGFAEDAATALKLANQSVAAQKHPN